MNQLNTERLEKRRAINARVGFRLLPVLQMIFRKVQRFGSAKGLSFQLLTKSVLKWRSPEVWRKAAEESEFSRSAGSAQCRALCAKARVYWGFFRADEPAENIWRGATGGPRRTGIQHSPHCGKLTARRDERAQEPSGDCATASAGQHGRSVEKAIVIDLLDEEICHIGSRDESRGPVVRIDQHAVCARVRSVG